MNSTILARATAVIPQNELLVNIVRLRVRQLAQGARPLVLTPPGMGLSDVALTEIAEGKLNCEPALSGNPEALAPAIITFPSTAVAKKKAA